jgi:multiple antibiotic resistance protein
MVYESCPSPRAARIHGVGAPAALARARALAQPLRAGAAYDGDRRRECAGVNAVASAFLLTFAGLFPIVNPLEAAPFFLALTASLPASERSALARRIALNGFALLLGSMALGPWLLEVFGIELPVVRIAGGLVVAALGWKLLTQEQWSDHGGSDLQGGQPKKIGSFYPLTLPLTVGPGSMSVAITIGSGKPAGIPRFSQLAEHATGAVLGVVAIAVTIYLAYRFAENIARLLGETGLEVLVRLSAFILMCIGIEIIWSGYSALIGVR